MQARARAPTLGRLVVDAVGGGDVQRPAHANAAHPDGDLRVGHCRLRVRERAPLVLGVAVETLAQLRQEEAVAAGGLLGRLEPFQLLRVTKTEVDV